MLVRMLKPAIGILIITLAHAGSYSPSVAQNIARPIILPLENYNCLVGYADRLAVSSRGNMINVSACPPKIEVGFTPPPALMRNYLILTADDVQCLLQARRQGHRVAFMHGPRKVAVYLRPCGRKR